MRPLYVECVFIAFSLLVVVAEKKLGFFITRIYRRGTVNRDGVKHVEPAVILKECG